MNPFIPDFLQRHIVTSGALGAKWLNELPRRIVELEQSWDFQVGPAFNHRGAVSWVAPVTLADGTEAVLKIGMPCHEARFEGEALQYLDDYGAVRLLQLSEDGFSMLLERCRPGTDLWPLSADEGDGIACRVLARMWRTPPPEAPFVSLSDFVAQWWENLPYLKSVAACGDDVVAEVVGRGRELSASQPRNVLLHGDFHPGNVLSAQREPWLLIDPKPLVGDPAYDLAQWLYNRARFVIQSADAVAILRQLIDSFALELGLDNGRIAGWLFVKAFGWEYGPEFISLFQEVAKAW